ncbi:hypothetical protein GCM10010201_05740 [Pilimelia columellifera subsp. columellifera]|uniref:Uncharacterized protein n=1 Tax=Pilimelia columellifera subsp. columellifera TaxID=706583 RepID=A0ABN3N316_9ACTN
MSDDAVCDATQILAYAADGDHPAVVLQEVRSVIERSGLGAVYDVVLCLADTVLSDRTLAGPPAAGCALSFPGIDAAPYDLRWTARFLSAYACADADTHAALFGAAADDGRLVECVAALAASTVATLRLAA